MSDPQYDTEFWFNATLYTAYEWHGDFDTEEDAREAFDAWLNSIRAEAWDEAYEQGIDDERISESNIGIAGLGGKIGPCRRNPYRGAGE